MHKNAIRLRRGRRHNGAYPKLFLACIAMIAPIRAYAEDAAPKSPDKPAVWIAPAAAAQTALSWRDRRPSAPQPSAESRVAATGQSAAVIETMGTYRLTDAGFKSSKTIEFPAPPEWMTIDASGNLLVYADSKLYRSENGSDFAAILELPGVRAIDGADSVIAYADGQKLSIADLTQGTVRSIALTDFFDDEKVNRMTPEAAAKAEAEAAKKTKKNKSAAKDKKSAKSAGEASSGDAVQIAEILGIWLRHDGAGVIRLRSILNVRTFATADYGRTWRMMNDAPESIRHEFGLIWDGASRVLSQDATQWIEVSGPEYRPAARFLPSQTRVAARELPSDWTRLASPQTAAPAQNASDPQTDDASDAQTCFNPDGSPCAKLAMIPAAAPAVSADFPIMRAVARADETAPAQNAAQPALYAPEPQAQGLRLGLYSDARCILPDDCAAETMQAPHAWILRPGDAAPETIDLPQECLPRFIGAQNGLGLVFCEGSNDQIDVYARSAESDWVFETQLPESVVSGGDVRLLPADDGTLIVVGSCQDESIGGGDAADPADPGAAAAPETRTVCSIAARRPNEIGIAATPVYRADGGAAAKGDETSPEQPPAKTIPTWRAERPENAVGIVPVGDGRFLTVETLSADAPAHLLRLWLPGGDAAAPESGSYSEILSDAFDPAPFSGLVMTGEGCLSLFDGAQTDRLLAADGGYANMTCADSRAAALAAAAKRDAEAAKGKSIGDDHYGVRLGGGGFFSVGSVKTWFMRVEALIPLYGGQYEIGLMYRMAGGNASNVMGHLGIASVRWRYDGFELFDFAVGAGIGYGTMCGYKKPASDSSETEDEETSDTSAATQKSGYEKCSAASLRYLISGIAAYKLNSQWKIFLSAELLGGSSWGFDVAAGIEVRF